MNLPSNGYRFKQETLQREYIDKDRLLYGPDENRIIQIKLYLSEYRATLRSVVQLDGRLGAYAIGDQLGKDERHFKNPKPPQLITQLVDFGNTPEQLVLDYFAGSGTTAHAVIDLNREDGEDGKRRFLLVEMGDYFEPVLVKRVAKAMYGPGWRDGKATTHDAPVPGLVEVFSIESYEEALDALPLRPAAPHPQGEIRIDPTEPEGSGKLLRYLLDVEHGPDLFPTGAFADPWSARLGTPGPEAEAGPVDLVATFSLLLGLRVRTLSPVRRYAASFERADHPEGDGRLTLAGEPEEDPGGPFAVQMVTGRDPGGAPVAALWRSLTGEPEEDAAFLAWAVPQLPERDWSAVYANGPAVAGAAEGLPLQAIEPAFRRLMFEAADAEAADRG